MSPRPFATTVRLGRLRIHWRGQTERKGESPPAKCQQRNVARSNISWE